MNAQLNRKLLTAPAHDGPTYEPEQDEKRLTSLRERVLSYMLRKSGGWCTLDELVANCGGTTASVSAKARDLRARKHGSWTVESERVRVGLWRYRIGGPR